jgi:hypothetical protein
VLRRASRVPERHVHRHEPLPLHSCAIRDNQNKQVI